MPATCTIRIPLTKEPLTVTPSLAYDLLDLQVVSEIQEGQFQAHDFYLFWATMKRINR